MRNSLALFASFGIAALHAQGTPDLFKKAPPAVDRMLRDRVAGFFQSHVDGKFRQADQYVADDSKEAFFAAEKQRYRGFEIVRINYNEDFTKATAVVSVGTKIINRGQGFEVNAPIASSWKSENGQWFWYADLEKIVRTPFGGMTPGPGDPNALSQIPRNLDASVVLGKVKLSKPQLTLSSFKRSHDEIEIVNNLLGTVEVQLASLSAPGLKLVLDRTILLKGEKAKITADYLPPNQSAKETLEVEFLVVTTQEKHIVPIVFEIPAQIKQQLPPAAQGPK